MLIPALFVADAVAFHAGPARSFDIVVVTDPEAATETERRWMREHGIHHHVEDFADPKAVIRPEGLPPVRPPPSERCIRMTITSEAAISAWTMRRKVNMARDLAVHPALFNRPPG